MKIGILTFHRAENFGAVLQAYALQTFLRQQGYEASLIDYRCKAIEVQYHIFNPAILWSRKNVLISLRAYLDRFKNVKDRKERKRKYEAFRERQLVLTPYTQATLKEFDGFIVGSDQVWNLHLTGGLDSVYFLNFPMKPEAKRISYAASSDKDPDKLIERHQDKIALWLDKFNALSVREGFLKEEIQPYTSKPIAVCLDPSFLLSKEDYLKLAIKPAEKEKYVLVYHMTPTETGTQLADKIAAEKGWKVIEIHGGYTRQSDDRHKSNLAPAELLGYIAYAEMVVTTSFHGLSLSLILQKEVWVINKGDNLRQRNIIEKVGISQRLINDCKDYQPTALDYNEINAKLGKLIAESKQFLISSIG